MLNSRKGCFWYLGNCFDRCCEVQQPLSCISSQIITIETAHASRSLYLPKHCPYTRFEFLPRDLKALRDSASRLEPAKARHLGPHNINGLYCPPTGFGNVPIE